MDVVVTLLLLTLLSPLFLFLPIPVVADGGPGFLAHDRVGPNGITFGCLRFRAMTVGVEKRLAKYMSFHPEAVKGWKETKKLVSDPCVTVLGAILRKTSLDELPQLWNVLVEQMSLIGPRRVKVGGSLGNTGPHSGPRSTIPTLLRFQSRSIERRVTATRQSSRGTHGQVLLL
jgi:exopolysaccharide production protein ExoY